MTTKKKKILFVIPYLANGGAERALSNIIMHFPEEWEIDIVINSDQRIDYSYRGNLITLGIDEKPKTSSVFFQAKAFLKRWRKLRMLKKKNHYLACISFLDSANVANILSGENYCKVVVSVRSSLANQSVLPQYKYIVNPLVRLFYNKADKVVAVSKGSGTELNEVYHIQRQKIEVIGNGYDVKEIYRDAQQEIEQEFQEKMKNKMVFVTFGRLEKVKGHIHLLKAFARVAKQRKDVILLIVGDGSERIRLQNLVAASEIKNKVIFVGYQRNPYKYVSRANIFVIPSLYEGFPNALAEAVCMKIPCIATDFQTGAREIIAPELLNSKKAIEKMTLAEYGIITPLCSENKCTDIEETLQKAEQELVKAMILLLDDNDLYEYYKSKMAQRSQELDIYSVVKRWINVIEN